MSANGTNPAGNYLFSFGSINDKITWALQVEHSLRVTREHIKRTEKLLDQLNENFKHADQLSRAAKLSAARELMSTDQPRTVKELCARVAARVLRASTDMANAGKKAADAADDEIPSDYDDMGQLESAVTKEDNSKTHEDTAQLEDEIGTATTMEQLKEQLTTALSEKNAAIAQVTELQSEVTYYHTMLKKIDKTMQSINKLESSVRKETKTKTKIANMVHKHQTEISTIKHQLKQKHEQLLAASTKISALSLQLATANTKAESQTRKVITVRGELVNTALKLDSAEKRLAAPDWH